MPSISSSSSLALAAKLKRLFENSPDKFLSFPIGLAYPTRFFSFMQADGGLSAVDQNRYQLEFARFTNMLPPDAAAFPPDADTSLGNVYKQALDESVFASSTLTPVQTTQLEQAIDFLTDKQVVDGTELFVSSAAVRTYYEYKTVYDDLNRQYLDEKLTVQFAPSDEEGQKLREAWKLGKEKLWLDQIQQAENDWVNLGFRDTVKHHQSMRADLEPKRSSLQFKKACLDDLELAELPDLNANGLPSGYTTFFSPSNVFDPATPWPSVTLSKSEILTLATQAPPELAERFGGELADGSIERLSFEYNKVVVIRPWLNGGFLTARTWKFPGDARLSDGNMPRTGRLPAYISSLVAVRNLRITRLKSDTPRQPVVIPIISKERLGKFSIRPAFETPPIVPKKPVEVMLHTSSRTVVAEPAAQQPTVRDHRWRYRQAAQQASTIRVPIRMPTKNGPSPTRPSTQLPPWRPPVPVGGGRPAPRPIPQFVEEKFNFDGIVIVAFECARLPKSPNPDLTLPWESAQP